MIPVVLKLYQRAGEVSSHTEKQYLYRVTVIPICTTFSFARRTLAFSTRPIASQGVSTVLQQMEDSPTMQVWRGIYSLYSYTFRTTLGKRGDEGGEERWN